MDCAAGWTPTAIQSVCRSPIGYSFAAQQRSTPQPKQQPAEQLPQCRPAAHSNSRALRWPGGQPAGAECSHKAPGGNSTRPSSAAPPSKAASSFAACTPSPWRYTKVPATRTRNLQHHPPWSREGRCQAMVGRAVQLRLLLLSQKQELAQLAFLKDGAGPAVHQGSTCPADGAACCRRCPPQDSH